LGCTCPHALHVHHLRPAEGSSAWARGEGSGPEQCFCCSRAGPITEHYVLGGTQRIYICVGSKDRSRGFRTHGRRRGVLQSRREEESSVISDLKRQANSLSRGAREGQRSGELLSLLQHVSPLKALTRVRVTCHYHVTPQRLVTAALCHVLGIILSADQPANCGDPRGTRSNLRAHWKTCCGGGALAAWLPGSNSIACSSASVTRSFPQTTIVADAGSPASNTNCLTKKEAFHRAFERGASVEKHM